MMRGQPFTTSITLGNTCSAVCNFALSSTRCQRFFSVVVFASSMKISASRCGARREFDYSAALPFQFDVQGKGISTC